MFPGNNKLCKFSASVYHKPFLFPVADLRGAKGAVPVKKIGNFMRVKGRGGGGEGGMGVWEGRQKYHALCSFGPF